MRRVSRIMSGVYALLLVSLFVTSAMAFDVPVSVANGTQKSGRVFLTIESQSGGSTGVGKSALIDASSTSDVITIRGLQSDGAYRMTAFLDTQERGTQHANDPAGATTFTVAQGVVTDSGGSPSNMVKVTLADPVPVAAAPPASVSLIPGQDWAIVAWDHPRSDSGLIIADSYNVYWSTEPDPGPENVTGGDMRFGVPAIDGGPVLLTGLSTGTSLYAAVVPVVDGNERLEAKAVSSDPVVIGPTDAAGSSVTVTVDSFDIDKNIDWPTPLVVAVSDDKDNIRLAVVGEPGDSETVTVTGVPAGSYRVYTALDLSGNGYLSGGQGVIGMGNTIAPMVTVDGTNPVTAGTVDLSSQLSTLSEVGLSIDHGRTRGVDNSDTYAMNIQVRDQGAFAVNVSYDESGIDLARTPWGEYSYRSGLPGRPEVGDSFGIAVEYSDGSTQTMRPSVTAVLDSFPTATAPVGKTSDTEPTFSWAAPDATPAAYGYALWLDAGFDFGADDLPSSQLSLPYRYNGDAPALTPGKSYQWSIAVTDQKGNSARETASFQVTNPPISFSGAVRNSAGAGLADVTVQVAAYPSLSATSAGDGSFTITGIFPGEDFTVKASGAGIADTYAGPFNSTSNISGKTIRVRSTSELGDWGSATGKGVITGQVVVPGTGVVLEGAAVSVVSATGSYTVLYDDGNGNPVAGTATGGDGRFYILNVNDGDVVTLGAAKDGWSFNSRPYTGHANAVNSGDIAARTIRFSGRLVDTADSAVAGAAVQMLGYAGITTVTAGDGSFTLDGLPADREFALYFNKGGFAPLYSSAITAQSDVNDPVAIVIFTPGEVGDKALLTGVVVDQATGTQGGVSVNAASSLHPDIPYAVTYFDGTNYGGVATYGNGVFAVRDVADGDTVTVTALKAGYTPVSQKFVAHAGAATEGLIFLSGSTIRFSGTVADSSSAPLSGATVQMAGNGWVSTTSRGDGTFTLDGVPKETPFSVAIGKPGYLSAYGESISASFDLWAPAPYILYTSGEAAAFGHTPGKGAIRARVVDGDNAMASLGGAAVTAASALHPQTPYTVTYFDGSSYGGSSTNGNGIFVVANVDDGDTVTVTATKAGYYSGDASYRVHADAVSQGTLSLNIVPLVTANPPFANFGAVLVGTSQAKEITLSNVSDATVTVKEIAGPDGAGFSWSSGGTSKPCRAIPFTFAAGESCTVGVTFAPLAPGMVNSLLGIKTDTHTYSVGVSGYAFEAVPVPSISALAPDNGTVGTEVVITGSNFAATTQGNTVMFNGTTATVTSAGANALKVKVPPGAASGSVTVINSGGTAFSAIPFNVITSVTMTGAVADSAGVGIAGATVACVGTPFATVTDGNGNFVLNGLPAGQPFSVVVSADGYSPTYTGSFETTSNIASLSPYTLFTPDEVAGWGGTPGTGVIRSRVADAANQDRGYLSGAVVTATSSSHPDGYPVVYYDGESYGGTATSGNGVYLVLNVNATDTVTVTATKEGWGTGSDSLAVHADAVSEGRVLLAGPTIQYSGRVTDFSNNGVAGALVVSSGNASAYTTTSGDGSFALPGLPLKSTFSLKLSKNGYRPVYTVNMNEDASVSAFSPFRLYTAQQVALLGVTPGKGVITTQVMDYAHPGTYLGNAVVTANSRLHPETPYTVSYFDGTKYGGSVTYSNGIVMVPNIDDGDTVTLTVSKSGWSTGLRSYTYEVHGDAVSEGVIGLFKMNLSVKPRSLDFGSVTVGASAEEIIAVTNISYDYVEITGSSVTGPNAAMYSVYPAGDNPCEIPGTFGSGDSCTLGVRFRPTSAGATDAVLGITTSNTSIPPLPVPLTGYGAADTEAPSVTTFTAPAVTNKPAVAVTVSATDNGGIAGYLIKATTTSTPPSAPLASDKGWSANAPTSYTVAGAGTTTLYVWAKDLAGNVSATPMTAKVTVDQTAPAISFKLNSVSGTAVNATSVPLTLSATDASGVTGYLVSSTQSTAPSAAATEWAASAPGTFPFASTGTKTLYAYAKDAAGNVAAAKITFNIDLVLPAVTTFTVKSLANTLAVPVSFIGSDSTAVAGYSGVNGYMITTAPTAPLPASTGWSATAPASYTFPGAGTYTLYAWVRDAAGNVSAAKTAAVTIDQTAPVVTFTVPGAVKTLVVPVTLSATDATGYLITTTSTAPLATAPGWSATAATSYTFTSAGSKTLYAWAKDAAGNVSAVKSATTVIDQSAPVITAFTLKNPSAALTVPVTFTATGATGYIITANSIPPLATAAGWSATPPTSYAFTSSGSKLLWAWAKDDAGNVSNFKSAATTITLTGPVVTSFVPKAAVNTLKVPITSFTAVNGTGFMITATPTAPLASAAGWSATAPTSYTFPTAGSKVLYAWVKNAAGQVSPAVSAAVNVDMTAPAITAFTLKTPVNSLSVPVTAFTASDATGVTGYMITTTSTAPLATATTWSATAPTSVAVATAGLKTLYAWVRDAAGNVSAVKSAAVNVDLTAPVVLTFTVKSPVTTLAVPVSAFTASDAVGVAGFKITETSTKPLATATGWSATAPTSYTFATKGTKALYGWAKDAAGNVSLSKTVTAIIN